MYLVRTFVSQFPELTSLACCVKLNIICSFSHSRVGAHGSSMFAMWLPRLHPAEESHRPNICMQHILVCKILALEVPNKRNWVVLCYNQDKILVENIYSTEDNKQQKNDSHSLSSAVRCVDYAYLLFWCSTRILSCLNMCREEQRSRWRDWKSRLKWSGWGKWGCLV